jgi:hypothetical protein
MLKSAAAAPEMATELIVTVALPVFCGGKVIMSPLSKVEMSP